jgi:succinyl-CoA synthetase beta subunit
VKAQVLTGGRGKAGGIKLADSPDEARTHAEAILGMDINGHVVRRLWIERASEIAKEYYLSVTFDRGEKKPLFMFTTQGGVDIEQVAEESPDALVRLHVDPMEGFQPWVARALVYGAGLEDPSEQKQIAAIVERLYAAFVGTDAMLCEINPLIVTPDGEVRPSTRSSPSTTTRSSATTTSPRCAIPSRSRPRSASRGRRTSRT